LPVTEAPPDVLEEVVRDVIAERDAYRPLAARGVDFVRRTHDGRRSARVLQEALDLRGLADGPASAG
ncbi:MAG TPA: hypothetical protein VF140_10720, partial [Phycicoccus sp.]